MLVTSESRCPKESRVSSLSYSLLPPGFVKLNFDRAYKGNLRPVGYEGIFHDDMENALRIYASYCEYTINNLTKFQSSRKRVDYRNREMLF